MLVRDISLDAARKRLEGDIYVTGGAWDMSKVTLSHFRPSWRMLIPCTRQATITAVAVAKLP